jgi:hypothetical protein
VVWLKSQTLALKEDGEELLGTIPAVKLILSRTANAGVANAGAWQVCTSGANNPGDYHDSTVPRSVAPRLRCGTIHEVRPKSRRLWAEPYPCQRVL